MPKTGVLRSPYLLAGTTGAIAGYLVPCKPVVNYVNGLLSVYVADQAILRKVSPSLFGVIVAVLVLGASRRVRAHLVRLLLAWDGWFLNRSRGNRQWTMMWGATLRLLLGKKNHGIGSYQDLLPTYPLPALNQTLEKYLRSVRPLLSEEEFKEVHESVKDFETGEGMRLQLCLRIKSLISRNWLSDWWLEYVYLRSRGSLAVNSNYFAMDAPVRPTTQQIDRAVATIWLVLNFLKDISVGKVENALNQGIVPFDSSYYYYVCRGCRIPHEECDELVCDDTARHIVVLRRGKYYKVEVIDRKGNILSKCQLKEKLQYIINLAGDLDDDRPIAGLTAQERTIWAKQRKELMKNSTNRDTIEAIEHALMFISLEHEHVKDITERCIKTLIGNSKNVWFDKCASLLVFDDGHMSYNVEHSNMDATVFEHMMEHCANLEQYDENGHLVDHGEPGSQVEEVKQLLWNFEGHEDYLELSIQYFQKCLADSDLVIHVSPYGKRVPKECRCSPDGWIQMALQLTWYRMHKNFVLTYEAATTRMFYEGRTETIRPVSEFSCQFARCFDDPLVSPEEKKDLLSKAIQYQEKSKFEAMRGQGFDRHLFGLYLLAKYFNLDPFPKFLSGNPFAYLLSTSQTPVSVTKGWSEERTGEAGGFGTVVQEGYGVAYLIVGEDKLTFSIHSSKSFSETDSQKFAETLTRSLNDMKALFKSP